MSKYNITIRKYGLNAYDHTFYNIPSRDVSIQVKNMLRDFPTLDDIVIHKQV